MGYWYHPEIEEQTVGAIMDYDQAHPRARWRLVFAGGQELVCSLVTYYESENSGELDIPEDDPRYDEFYEVLFRIIEIVRGGDSETRVGDLFPVSYREFPHLITDADTGVVIYPVADGHQDRQ